MPVNTELLSKGLAALGFPPEGALADSLARYTAEIELWNPQYGLVRASGDELITKHILDSLAAAASIRALADSIRTSRSAGAAAPSFGLPAPRLRLADIGSGAGLPGIPLALAFPEFDVSLIERMGKRVRFLENEKARLGLSTVSIVEKEVERVDTSYDIIVFRAFRPFERKLFSSVFALCEPDGYIAAYKGRKEKAEAELPEIKGLYTSASIVPLKVPFLDEERCLVVLSAGLSAGSGRL